MYRYRVYARNVANFCDQFFLFRIYTSSLEEKGKEDRIHSRCIFEKENGIEWISFSSVFFFFLGRKYRVRVNALTR